MTPNHPIPPERIRAEAERVAREASAKHNPAYDFDKFYSWIRKGMVESAVAGIEHGMSLVDVSAVQREAARKAIEALCEFRAAVETHALMVDGYQGLQHGAAGSNAQIRAFLDPYLAVTYPAHAPRECVLSDGSVVTVHDGMFKWYGSTVGHLTTRNWRDLADTGADFDALKQFAERAK